RYLAIQTAAPPVVGVAMVGARRLCEREPMSFAAMMALEPHGDDRFTGRGPRYPWGFLYGGQVVAQAIRAAAATVRSGESIHSLHAYYASAGDDGREFRLEVERVRDGRSFSIRSVRVSQGTRVLASVVASFHVDEPSEQRSPVGPPPVANPDD